jgi:hypothetical protein
MRFSFRGINLGLGSAALIFFCSCDKHHLGEMPEVQKEHVELAKPGEAAAPAANESKASSTHGPSPTPAEFFPEKKSP